jgi:hypothetical protein
VQLTACAEEGAEKVARQRMAAAMMRLAILMEVILKTKERLRHARRCECGLLAQPE